MGTVPPHTPPTPHIHQLNVAVGAARKPLTVLGFALGAVHGERGVYNERSLGRINMRNLVCNAN
jgi:hypothetical protein